jgi:hypothetical protein
MRASLLFWEQVLVGLAWFSFCLWVGFLFEAWWRQERVPGPLFFHSKVCLTLRGAIQRPGPYWIKAGKPVHGVLIRARPQRNADLSGIDPGERILKDRELTIPAFQCLKVEVRGEVLNQGVVVLPLQSSLSSLISLLELTQEADATLLSKARKLKDGEVIYIKKKLQPELLKNKAL